MQSLKLKRKTEIIVSVNVLVSCNENHFKGSEWISGTQSISQDSQQVTAASRGRAMPPTDVIRPALSQPHAALSPAGVLCFSTLMATP